MALPMHTNGNTPAPLQPNAKPGAYPFGDRANLFGTFLVQFHQNPRDSDLRVQAYEAMLAITYPKARKDQEFMRLYDSVRGDGVVEDGEMVRLVMEMCRVLDDLGTWDWRTDEIEELVVPSGDR